MEVNLDLKDNMFTVLRSNGEKCTVWAQNAQTMISNSELIFSLFEPSFLLKQWGRTSLFETWKFVKFIYSNDELKLTVWEICIELTEKNSLPFFAI